MVADSLSICAYMRGIYIFLHCCKHFTRGKLYHLRRSKVSDTVKIFHLFKNKKAPRTGEKARAHWILNGRQCHHSYIAFCSLSLTLHISTSPWTGRLQFPCPVTTFSWTYPWGGQNPVGFIVSCELRKPLIVHKDPDHASQKFCLKSCRQGHL